MARTPPASGDGGVVEKTSPRGQSPSLPTHKGDVENGNDGAKRRPKLPVRVKTEGESGRRGFHPLHFLRIGFRSASKVSAAVNLLWPVVPATIACRYKLSDTPDHHVIIFILSYLAMIPCANMIGFAGQELARKVPHVFGVLTETTVGSIVEIVLFMILLSRGFYHVIQAAILGSILATMLLCLGLCFFAGGLRRHEQTFNEAVSEVGSGLLFVAGFGLAVPTIFQSTVASSALSTEEVDEKVLKISRITAILLIIAYLLFVWFQARSHNGIYDAIFEKDEERDHDRERDLSKDKFTFTECIIALVISVTLVTVVALSLVEQIEPIVENQHVSDAFMGLILVPLVEKIAEHLTAIDEAWDNQMNFALAHVLGATLQTALFNGPLVVIVGWGLNRPMGLEFEMFDIAMLLLAILAVGNFLRDQKSNYLEGFLCVIVYIAIAVAAFNYPDPAVIAGGSEGNGGGNGTEGAAPTGTGSE